MKPYIKLLQYIFRGHQSSPISKIEVAEDSEPTLTKVDVVLNFTLEVTLHLFTVTPSINYSVSSYPSFPSQRGREANTTQLMLKKQILLSQ